MTSQARLLLVDDDEAGRDLLGRRLARRGYIVDTAADGDQTLARVTARSYDLVLLDHVLTGLSGLDVLRRIRETWSPLELPVIMVTGVPESQELVSAMQSGANDYITKPIDFPIALARIETRLRLAESTRELRRANDFYRLAMSASEGGFWDWDLTAGKIDYSDGWKSMLGYGGDEVSEAVEEWFGRIHPIDRQRVEAEIQAILGGKAEVLETEYRVLQKDGHCRWVANRGSASRDRSGRLVRLAGHQTDITARKTIDPLTSFPNRTWLEDELDWLAAQGRAAALLLIELEHFERLEESLPPEGADRVLWDISQLLGACIQSRPDAALTLVRSGSRQFAVLDRDVRGTEHAREVANQVHACLRSPVLAGDEAVFVRASVGIAASGEKSGGEQHLRDAGAALRYARQRGTRCEVFQSAVHQQELAEVRLENDLRRAVERSEFVVHYQPKVDLANGRIVGFEALVRWNRPGYGLIPPQEFIEPAERTGLILPLGRFVLQQACQDTVRLRARFPDIKVSVNVSGRQLVAPGLVEEVRECLAASGLEPTALQLEITETFLVQEPEMALRTMQELRQMGVGLKLDDIGSGYASLDYLRRFPFDTIKIDRSFVTGLLSSHESDAIVTAMAGLARSLHMDVVAEGVETRAQLDRLTALGCDYGQGFWFSPPVEYKELCELLEHQTGSTKGVGCGDDSGSSRG